MSEIVRLRGKIYFTKYIWCTVDPTDFSELLKLQFCGGTWRRRQGFDMRGTVSWRPSRSTFVCNISSGEPIQLQSFKDKLQIMFGVAGIAVGKNITALTLVLTNK